MPAFRDAAQDNQVMERFGTYGDQVISAARLFNEQVEASLPVQDRNYLYTLRHAEKEMRDSSPRERAEIGYGLIHYIPPVRNWDSRYSHSLSIVSSGEDVALAGSRVMEVGGPAMLEDGSVYRPIRANLADYSVLADVDVTQLAQPIISNLRTQTYDVPIVEHLDVVADGCQLPVVDDSLDVVAAKSLWTYERPGVLSEAARTVREGGALVWQTGTLSDLRAASELGFEPYKIDITVSPTWAPAGPTSRLDIDFIACNQL
ncbi:MAG TPA: methyltransferase domain-containing protein [Candidatus Limnocylindria bacterium]|nr:methyltransferase domain-containing protein [Candidatus Limnocylindria bacterium]